MTIEFTGWICPLTPLENWLRAQGGGRVYEGSFIARYLLPVLYPDDLTRGAQVLLGVLALATNVAIYVWVRRRAMILAKPAREGRTGELR